jgi:cell division septum initiation protein DivIVA
VPDDEPLPPVGARFRRSAARPRVPEARAPDDARPPVVPTPGPADPPTFALVRQGYDPVQVDERIRVLDERIRTLDEQVRALREEVRKAQAERAEAERTVRSLRATPPVAPSGHEVEDKIARVERHEAARLRVTALADAARLLEDASAEAARAREDARRAAAERAAADQDLTQRLARVEERERRLRGQD